MNRGDKKGKCGEMNERKHFYFKRGEYGTTMIPKKSVHKQDE